MKKMFLTLVAVCAMTLSANAIVLRGTHKLCCEGSELTLYPSGRMVFWDQNQTYQGSYTIQDGYLLLLDENGNQFYACKYHYKDATLYWINVGGKTFRRC